MSHGSQMSVRGLVTRFVVIYAVPLVTFELLRHIGAFKSAGLAGGISAFLAAAVACFWFCGKNVRTLTRDEKREAILALWLFLFLCNVGVLLLRGLASGVSPVTMLSTMFGAMVGLLIGIWALQLLSLLGGFALAEWIWRLEGRTPIAHRDLPGGAKRHG